MWTSQCHASGVGIINKDATVLTGQELEHRSPEEPANLFEHTRVYAGIAPAQKIAIVKALQARGEFFVKYTMTSNSGEIWTIFLAPLFGWPIPLLPIQVLWINLVTDGLLS